MNACAHTHTPRMNACMHTHTHLHGLNELNLLLRATLGVRHLALDLESLRGKGLESVQGASAVVRLALLVTILHIVNVSSMMQV